MAARWFGANDIRSGAATMLNECFNPKCHRDLHYLRTGRVVRITRNDTSRIQVEHFWLCGECYRSFDFHFAGDGTMSMVAKKPCRFSVEEGWYLADTEQRMTA